MLKITSLKNQKQFDLVNNNSKFFASSNIKIVSSFPKIDNQINVDQVFIGFKITRKIANAVIRNKIRRRIKSIIRNLIRDNHNISPSQAFIIIPRKLIIEKNYKDIEEEIKGAFHFLNKKLNQLNSIKLIDSVLN